MKILGLSTSVHVLSNSMDTIKTSASLTPSRTISSALLFNSRKNSAQDLCSGPLTAFISLRKSHFHHRYNLSFYMLLHTGMRRSELTGLKWKDVNFDKQVLEVKRSGQMVEGEFEYLDLKNKSSRRQIALSKKP